ncbi:Lrp/AsnC ligand binding domain protein [compost metagenome]
MPEVTEIQTFLGSVDLRLSVIARDMAHWQQVYRDSILTLPHVSDSDALMLISTIKDLQELPL